MENFVTFEIAKKLKEKGFREKCLLHYESTGGLYSNSIDTYDCPNQELDYSDFLKCYNDGNSIGLIDTPTISQVLKWLRDEKHIHICTDFDKDMNWFYQIAIYGSMDTTAHDYGFKSYEEADLAGIEYVLNNLI